MPRVSTHGQSWLYATDDIAMAAVFLSGRGGDFTCATGTYDHHPYLVERFAGAIDLRYCGIKGSIYVLPSEGFIAEQTSWSKDFVCSDPVVPLREIRVNDAKTYLLQLADEGKLTIMFYPYRFPLIPADDEDLVERAVKWHKAGIPAVLEQVKEYHPSLHERVLRAITENRY